MNIFPMISTFDHEGPDVFNAIRELMVGLFEHLGITYILDVEFGVKFV